MKALKIIGIILLVLVVLVVGAGTYVKVALPNTGPAPDLKVELTPQRIQRGEYLANHVNVCIDCHSTRDYSLYAAPMTGNHPGSGGEKFGPELGFPGTFYAPNITPYKLKDWTDGEVFRAITTGVNKDGKALFPLMTWEHVGKMDKEDVYSLIAYIRTLQPVANNIPQSQPAFPVNFIENTLPHKASFVSKPAESDTVQYGAYLVNAAACVDCHSKVDKGAVIPGTEFGGGREFKQPAGIVRSANITMNKVNGIGSWSKEVFIQRFKMYQSKDYTPVRVGPKDLNTPMPWVMYSGMKESDLAAIYAYLHSLKPISNKVNKWEKI